MASIPGQYDTDISGVLKGNNGMSSQQKLLPGSLQINDADAITLPFVDVLFHLKVEAGPT